MDSVLVETAEEMKIFGLVVRNLGEDGSEDGEGHQAVADALEQVDWDDHYGQQADVEDYLRQETGLSRVSNSRYKSEDEEGSVVGEEQMEGKG